MNCAVEINIKNNAWNVNNKMHIPKETKIYDKKVEEGLDNSEVTDISDESHGEEEIDSVIKGQINDRRGVDKNKKQRKKSK